MKASDFRLALICIVLTCFAAAACQRGDEAEKKTTADPFGLPINRVITTEALTDEVEVLVDSHGVAHVYAQNDHDAWLLQGYLTAQDRFFQMDLLRRLGTGRVTELLGEFPLVGSLLASIYLGDVDLYFRSVFMDEKGRPAVDRLQTALDESAQAVLQAYAEGINSYLHDVVAARNGAFKPPAYSGLINPDAALLDEWTIADTLAVLLVEQWSSANSVDLELLLGQALGEWGADKFGEFFTAATAAPGAGQASTKQDEAGESPDYESLAGLYRPARKALAKAMDAGLAAVSGLAHQNRAANLVAVDATRAAGGQAMLAADLAFRPLSPAPYHLIHLDSRTVGDGELSLAGFALPGLPGVQLGHNDRLGWIGATAPYDISDTYLEMLTESGDEVFRGGETVALRTIAEKFRLNMGDDAPSKEKEIQFVPGHGPLVPGSCKKGYCLALRWTGMQNGDDLNALIALQTSGSLDEGLEELARVRRGARQWMLADTDGRIAHLSASQIPQRDHWRTTPPWLPLPGMIADNGWNGEVPSTRLTRQTDPDTGLLIAADNDLYGTLRDGDATTGAYYFAALADPGWRAARLLELADDAGDELTPETLQAMLADDYSPLGELLIPQLLVSASRRPDLLGENAPEAVSILAHWDATLPAATPDRWRPALAAESRQEASRGAALFEVWLHHLVARTFADDFTAADLDPPADLFFAGPQLEARVLAALFARADDPFAALDWWDDLDTPAVESRDEIVLGALADAIGELTATRGADPALWFWGDLHAVETTLDFEGADLLDFVAPTGGPANVDGGDFAVRFGETNCLVRDYSVARLSLARIFMTLDGDRFATRAVLAGGQSERFNSPHFADQFARWAADETIDVPFAFADVTAAAVQRILFTPRP
ncbi:MAG: penicillin acylase family protein [Myxococcales bacterium]|nr:penicillin acylase family protein [Myxococcales bacterium]